MLYTLCKSGHDRHSIIYEMHAGLVNQLMACYWMDQGIELQSMESEDELTKTIERIRKRAKPKFDF